MMTLFIGTLRFVYMYEALLKSAMTDYQMDYYEDDCESFHLFI